MEEEVTVDDVFNEHEEEVTEVEETTEVETEEESVDETEEETGETEEVEESTESEKEPPSTDDSEKGLQSALLAERRKRQEAEERLRQQEEDIPDPTYEPEEYAKYMQNRTDVEARKIRIDLSRDMMIDSHSDFTDKEAVFMDMLRIDEDGNIRNRALYEEFMAAPNPARFAYNTANEHLEIQDLKSGSYKERLRAEILAEIEAEKNGEEPPSGKKSATQVPNLARATSVDSNSKKAEVLPENPKDLFND